MHYFEKTLRKCSNIYFYVDYYKSNRLKILKLFKMGIIFEDFKIIFVHLFIINAGKVQI